MTSDTELLGIYSAALIADPGRDMYDQEIAGLRAVAAAAWDEGFALGSMDPRKSGAALSAF